MRDYQKVEQEMQKNLFSICTLMEGRIYAFTAFDRLPIRFDLQTEKIILVEDIKDYDPSFVADNILSIGDNIFVLELNGRRLMQYKVHEGNCQYFEIDSSTGEWGNYAAFAAYGKYLYIFPKYKDMIVRIDFELGRVTKDLKSYSNMRKCFNIDQDENAYFSYGFQSGKLIWLFFTQSNLIAVYDMEQEKWGKYKLSVEIKNCVHAMEYNHKIYILSSEGKVYCWNISENKIVTLADCSKNSDDANKFSRIAVTDQYIYVLPALGEDIYIISLDTSKIELYHSYPDNFKYCGPIGWSKYYGYCENDNYYLFAMRTATFILCIDKKNGKIHWIKPKLPLYVESLKVFAAYWKKSVFHEKELSLEELFIYVKDKRINNHMQTSVNRGDQIWGIFKAI